VLRLSSYFCRTLQTPSVGSTLEVLTVFWYVAPCGFVPVNLLSSSLLSKNVKIKISRTIILLVALYGCETGSLTLSEECRLRVFENKVLRRIFGPKRDEVTGEWRRLYNEELYAVYSSPYVIRVMKPRRLR
jgi:hypothetical protein